MDRIEVYFAMALLFVSVAYISYRYSERFLDWLRFQSIGTRDYIVERLALMFIEVSPNSVLFAQFIASFGIGLIVFALVLPQVVPALMLGSIVTIVGWKAPRPIIDWMYVRRVKTFTLQMIDGLSLMSNGMKSGLSVVQSMGLVVQELPDPIRQEFNLVLSENKLGVSIEEAFNNLAKRIQSDDVEMFVTSVNILKETGGNLAETFDTITTTIRERIKLEQKIDAMTAMGRMQGMILLAVPGVLGAFIYTSDPDFMRPLFTTTFGWIILIVVVGLEVAAYVTISRIVKIDV
ncbi:MAG: type II secretion system F family protein [Bdellovibrionales bacterium]|nr:type II secretion system F family protein [Bdellovibrionales bacterium]